MTNNQIKYMIEVARTGSVNKAARNLFISQSALSNSISSVEQEFGRRIFNRTPRGVTLTSFGKLFIAYITPIDQQLDQLYAMKNTGNNASGASITIISNGFYYLSEMVAELAKRYDSTGFRISLYEDYAGNMVEAIAGKSADIGVVRLWSCYREHSLDRYSTMKLQYQPICECSVGVNVSQSNPLYHFNGVYIVPEQLIDYPQIVHESLDCGPYSDIFSKLGLPISRRRYVVNSRATLYELLDITDGYVLDSKKIYPDGSYNITNHNWRFLPLKDCPVRAEIGLLLRENTVLTAEVKYLTTMVKNYLLYGIPALQENRI